MNFFQNLSFHAALRGSGNKSRDEAITHQTTAAMRYPVAVAQNHVHKDAPAALIPLVLVDRHRPQERPLSLHPSCLSSSITTTVADVDTVVAATRVVLEKQPRDAFESGRRPPLQCLVRALVEQELAVEPGMFGNDPYKTAVKITAADFFNGLSARFGVRSFRGDFGQCNACGSWVKLVNLTVHAEKRCKALHKKENAKYWIYVAEGSDSEVGNDEDEIDEEEEEGGEQLHSSSRG
ncbi:hypothetical protein EXIGLDRAFT_782878 [Exidia glandulosa HHB12029]|uniref:Uncharacterized protein n=1 Tax=Exidia glandulosa HHB12029 TaxID=1314781 RepID=A0A166NDT7_EXIGL|nr:hypothetical protein EXIGLDRAFT_782878 [Exidia glandulosa HHB12029]